jgi:hypothetical protein
MVVDGYHPCEISVRDKHTPISVAKAAREVGVALRLLSDKLAETSDVDTVITLFREGYANVAKTKEQV